MWPNVDASLDLGHGGYKVPKGVDVEIYLNFHLVALSALHKVPTRLRGCSTLAQLGGAVHPCCPARGSETGHFVCRYAGGQETRTNGILRIRFSGVRLWHGPRDAHGVGIAVEEALCKACRYTTEYVDERLMAIRFEMAGHR